MRLISCNMTSSCNYFMLIWFLVLNIQDYRNTHLCERWCIHHCIHTQTESTLNSQSWNYNLWIRTSDALSYILKYMYCMCLLLSPDCSFYFLLITFSALFWPFNPWEKKLWYFQNDFLIINLRRKYLSSFLYILTFFKFRGYQWR